MSILGLLLAIAACVGCAFAGARWMRWRLEHEQIVAASEDPRDTQIRELLVASKMARENAARVKAAESSTTEELAVAHDRVRTLEKEVESATADLARMQCRLEELLGERNQLEEELARVRQERELLRARTQELELELNIDRRQDLLDPALQSG
jgi:chromosome segregation ATPase